MYRWQPECIICGKRFYPHRERVFNNQQVTCGKPACQRALKTIKQKEARLKQRGSTLSTNPRVSGDDERTSLEAKK